jgi:hypothetical protein
MELDVLGSGRLILAQRTAIVLNATIQHLHHLEVRLNAVVNVDAASNNSHRLFDYDRQLRRGERGVGGTGRGGSMPRDRDGNTLLQHIADQLVTYRHHSHSR